MGRVSDSVKDMLSPSWLVDLVSSVKKKTPPPETQPAQQRDQFNAYQVQNIFVILYETSLQYSLLNVRNRLYL